MTPTPTPPRRIRPPSRRDCLTSLFIGAAGSVVTRVEAGEVIADETPTPRLPAPDPRPPGGRSAMPLYDGPPVPGPFSTPTPSGPRRPKPAGDDAPEGSVGGSSGE